MRYEFEELDDVMFEYEEYIEENGLPYCDYKMHRGDAWKISPLQKFKYGINRIIRILKSYKANKLTDLLKQVQDQVKKDRRNKNQRLRDKVLKQTAQNFEERVEQIMFKHSEQLTALTQVMQNQTMMIQNLMQYQNFK